MALKVTERSLVSLHVTVRGSSLREIVIDSDPVTASTVKDTDTLSLMVSLADAVRYSVDVGVTNRVPVTDSESVRFNVAVTDSELVSTEDTETV